jgi:hypothetical protein
MMEMLLPLLIPGCFGDIDCIDSSLIDIPPTGADLHFFSIREKPHTSSAYFH